MITHKLALSVDQTHPSVCSLACARASSNCSSVSTCHNQNRLVSDEYGKATCTAKSACDEATGLRAVALQ